MASTERRSETEIDIFLFEQYAYKRKHEKRRRCRCEVVNLPISCRMHCCQLLYTILCLLAHAVRIYKTQRTAENERSGSLALSGPNERVRRAEPSRRERESGVERAAVEETEEKKKSNKTERRLNKIIIHDINTSVPFHSSQHLNSNIWAARREPTH